MKSFYKIVNADMFSKHHPVIIVCRLMNYISKTESKTPGNSEGNYRFLQIRLQCIRYHIIEMMYHKYL